MTMLTTARDHVPGVGWLTFVRVSCDFCGTTTGDMEVGECSALAFEEGWQRVDTYDECPDCVRRA